VEIAVFKVMEILPKYQARLLAVQVSGQVDSHWVVKLAQGSRSMDLCLTDSQAMIVNFRGAPGGDRFVQKYVWQPVLYKGRKFDCRVLSLMPPHVITCTTVEVPESDGLCVGAPRRVHCSASA
jgi:hypothetical protein